jgi:hypothetical protein
MKFSFKWNAFIAAVLVPGIIYISLGELRVPSYALSHKFSGSNHLFIYIIYVICILVLSAFLIATPKSDSPYQTIAYICVGLLVLYILLPIPVFTENITGANPPRRYVDYNIRSYPKTNIFLYVLKYVLSSLNILYFLICFIINFPRSSNRNYLAK